MAKTHTMTPARKAALKRAQAASARKRRGKGKGKLAAANRQIGNKRKKSRAQLIGAALVTAGFAYNTYRNAKNWEKTVAKRRMKHSGSGDTVATPSKRLRMHDRYFFAPHTIRGKRSKAKYG